MTQIESYFKGKLSNGFVIVTFLWSVFLFSGYVNNVQTAQQTTQTECPSSKITKRTVGTCSFTKAYTLLYTQKHPLSINAFKPHFLVAFNRRIKTVFDQITKQNLSFTFLVPFVFDKTIPQSSDDAFASLLLG